MSAGGKARILVSTTGLDPAQWVGEFRRLTDRGVVTEPDGPNDPSIRFAVVWKQPSGILAGLPNLKAIFSIGAGVDHLFRDPGVPDLPIVRVVAEDLTTRMSEYVVWQVLDHLRMGRIYREQQGRKIWREPAQPAAGDLTVGFMGLGVLGTDAARKLAMMGFRVAGWSRRARNVEGIATYHGMDALPEFLTACDIVVVLLPLTPDTRGIINRDLLRHMKKKTPIGGSVLINAGRGQLQVERDILEALDNGTLMAASLDVFETEPLPRSSPLWSHPRVFVTPHAAATSDPSRLAPEMVRQMDNFDLGLPLEHLVDRAAGY
jgi:glyoxylate/hydroxypyruvate reductase A